MNKLPTPTDENNNSESTDNTTTETINSEGIFVSPRQIRNRRHSEPSFRVERVTSPIVVDVDGRLTDVEKRNISASAGSLTSTSNNGQQELSSHCSTLNITETTDSGKLVHSTPNKKLNDTAATGTVDDSWIEIKDRYKLIEKNFDPISTPVKSTDPTTTITEGVKTTPQTVKKPTPIVREQDLFNSKAFIDVTDTLQDSNSCDFNSIQLPEKKEEKMTSTNIDLPVNKTLEEKKAGQQQSIDPTMTYRPSGGADTSSAGRSIFARCLNYLTFTNSKVSQSSSGGVGSSFPIDPSVPYLPSNQQISQQQGMMPYRQPRVIEIPRIEFRRSPMWGRTEPSFLIVKTKSFIMKSLIVGTIIYASVKSGVWGSTDESIELFNKLFYPETVKHKEVRQRHTVSDLAINLSDLYNFSVMTTVGQLLTVPRYIYTRLNAVANYFIGGSTN